MNPARLVAPPLRALVAAACALALAAPALAAPAAPEGELSRAALVADREGVAPGELVRVGVHFQLDEGWHLYWRNPGQVGQATEIGFQGPDGVDFSELRWPTPQRFTADNRLVSYGYEDEVLLFADVIAPADALEGEQLDLHANVDWLVCHTTCVTRSAHLDLTLTVRTDAPESAAARLFERASAAVPGAAPADLRVTAATSHDRVRPGDDFELVLTIDDVGGRQLEGATFFPEQVTWAEVSDVSTASADGQLLVRVKASARADAAATSGRLDGVLSLTRAGDRLAFDVASSVPLAAAGFVPTLSGSPLFSHLRPAPVLAQAAPPSAEAAVEIGGDGEEVSPALMLLFAFLGGLILNIMPCVLPVLSIKVLGLVQQAEASRKEIFWHGVAYTGGVLASFAALAIMVIVLQQSGKLVGWGFQLQSPGFVAVLGAIVFVFGLSLFGVFEVILPGMGAATAAANKGHGVGGSFSSGIFATLLATPCTAPLLAPALGFALAQPPAILFGYLLTVGLGLASPFLLLAIIPAWAKWLPKPGGWMVTFKKAMGFLLVATTIWIVDILAAQISTAGVIGYLAFLGVLSLAAWIYGHWGALHRPTGMRTGALVIALLISVLGGLQFLSFEKKAKATAAPAGSTEGIAWKDFAGTDVKALASGGATVFIDFTADWCVTCKVYESTVIETDDIKAELKRKCVVPVKADYTNEDDAITQWLKQFKRPGVPMYVILPAGKPDQPILLPDVLTKSALLDGLDKAGASTDQGKCAS